MGKNTIKFVSLFVVLALVIFVLVSLASQNLIFIVFSGLAFILYSFVLITLLRKLIILEKQNKINLERFAMSMEHVNHVLFDNVLEADMTNDCLIGENSEKLTALLSIPANSSYSKTIDVISRQMVDENYSEEYRRVLSVENVLKILEQGSNTLEFECIERSDGKNYRWIRAHYCIYKSNVTNCVKIISYVKNIEEEKRAYYRLVEKATTDTMTGLLNNVSTKEIVTDLLRKHGEQSSIILMIDIDNFKGINDTYGHDMGDKVIISICNIIKSNFRDTAIIGRMGGDEFLVCLSEKLECDNIHAILKQLISDVQNFSIPYKEDIVKDVTVSIGLVDTFGNENFDQLYHYADSAMYKAKSNGKNQYFVYDYTN